MSMVLQPTGWESHKIDFYTFGSQKVYVMGPSMVGQDWAMLKLNKTAWLAVPEATQPTLQGNQCSGAQTFSQLQMGFLTNKAARQWKTGSELKLRKGSSKYSERPLACLPTAGLPSFCFRRASLQPSIISSSEKTQSVRRGDGVRTGTGIWHKAQLFCQHSERTGRHMTLSPDPSSKF